jgi:hypothetical protein
VNELVEIALPIAPRLGQVTLSPELANGADELLVCCLQPCSRSRSLGQATRTRVRYETMVRTTAS